MRRRWTLALLAPMFLSPNAWAQNTPDQAADKFTNEFLLAQTERDRRLWISALMVGASNAAGLQDVELGRCLARWFFENEDAVYAEILVSMRAYPDYRPIEVIFAHARRECPELVPNRD